MDVFEKTFKFINDNWGEEAFSRKTANGTVRNEFVLYYFDGIAVSVASFIDRIVQSGYNDKVVECINQIKYGTELQSYKTGNISSVKARIRLFMEGVSGVLDGR